MPPVAYCRGRPQGRRNDEPPRVEIYPTVTNLMRPNLPPQTVSADYATPQNWCAESTPCRIPAASLLSGDTPNTPFFNSHDSRPEKSSVSVCLLITRVKQPPAPAHKWTGPDGAGKYPRTPHPAPPPPPLGRLARPSGLRGRQETGLSL